MKSRKGLTYEEGISKVIRIRLEKSEWAIIERAANQGRMVETLAKSTLGEAVASLLRIGFNCLVEHSDRYQNPQRLSKAQTATSELRVTKDPDHPLIKTIVKHADGTVTRYTDDD